MDRKVYASREELCLAEYLPCDYEVDYQDWMDEETQRGYNMTMEMSYEQFQNRRIPQRLYASVIRKDAPETAIGVVMISPPNAVPDLAIRVFAPYRGQGIGTRAFLMATEYAVQTYPIQELHAGCYEGNVKSTRMIEHCGYIRLPEKDQQETHYLTGEPITQYEYVFRAKKQDKQGAC